MERKAPCNRLVPHTRHPPPKGDQGKCNCAAGGTTNRWGNHTQQLRQPTSEKADNAGGVAIHSGQSSQQVKKGSKADEGSKPRRRLAVPVRQIYTESGNSGKRGRRQEDWRRAPNGVAGAAGPAQ